MKLKIVLLCLVGALTISATADAYYILPFGKARKFSKEWVREACEASGPSCVQWKVGHCGRVNLARVDCAAVLNYRSGEGCQFYVENRVMGNGYVHQRRLHLRCFKR